MTTYPHGTPSWVEINSADPDGSASFYGELFGWSVESGINPADNGGYRQFTKDGQAVAGLMRTMQENHPTVWATYISVDDADATAERITAARGQAVFGPMDVMDIGRMGVFLDPGQAAFGIWEPRSFTGADLVNVPGALCWNEVLTRDLEEALTFYPQVFGWSSTTADFAPSYHVWERSDGAQVGGCMAMTDERFPAEVPPHWAVTFAVEDTDATVERARALGAGVLQEAMDCPIGRFAGLRDPQGASFSVMAMKR